MEVKMRVEKKSLNDALRVLGKVVCQTSPVELYRSIRFIGDEDGAMAMATDGVEVVSVMLNVFAENEFDFCVPFRELKNLVRTNRSETLELAGNFIEFPAFEEPVAEAETFAQNLLRSGYPIFPVPYQVHRQEQY